jgi:glycosyltransferase involved in cell wall biosynthesis
MKWLIVEDALRDRKGHWLEYISTFVRGFTALGDEVTVLCDRKAEAFIMEQTGARPVLPESIWHRMGDGAGALRRYARVPGHAWATFVAMRRVFKEFNHGLHGLTRMGKAQGDAQGTCAGAAFSRPSTSKLARDSENTSPTRGAGGPASSLPATSHSLRATVPEALTPATSYSLPATSIPLNWIFVPTVLVHHLLGWWLLLKAGSVPRESRLLLFFPNLPIHLDNAGRAGRAFWNGGPTTKLMAWLLAQLRKEVESGRVVLGVETPAMQLALESLIGMKVVYLPHPVEFHAETRRRGGEEPKDGITTEDTESTEDCFVQKQGCAWLGQTGSSEPDSLTSKLADVPVSESLTRSASAPASSPATSYPQPATSAKPIVFGCYGAARWEKGSDIFQEAIKLILKNEVPSDERQVATGKSQIQPVTSYQLFVTASVRPLRFAIQWVEDFQDEKGNLVQLDPWLKNHPQVEVINRYFQGEEYEQCLEQTDVMVLPYRSPYRLRVSRVVIEAMMHGMPVIATKGTTLFEQAEEYGVAVGCEEGSAESLAEAILEVIEDFEMMSFSARERATTAAKSFSMGFFRELLERK